MENVDDENNNNWNSNSESVLENFDIDSWHLDLDLDLQEQTFSSERHAREEEEKTEMSVDLVRSLMVDLHLKNGEIHTLKNQLRHKELQIQSLLTREQQLQMECDQLTFKFAKHEQDLILLETQLQAIGNYERKDGVDMDSLRGKLLSFANDKISELGGLLASTSAELQNAMYILNETDFRKSAEADALKLEVENVCNQLAQRTVLYSAHQRRWGLLFRSNQGENMTLSNELLKMQNHLKSLESAYLKLDEEKLKILYKYNDTSEVNSRLTLENNRLTAEVETLNQEIIDLKMQNDSLHGVVSRLKNSDFGDLMVSTNAEENVWKNRYFELQSRFDNDVENVKLAQNSENEGNSHQERFSDKIQLVELLSKSLRNVCKALAENESTTRKLEADNFIQSTFGEWTCELSNDLQEQLLNEIKELQKQILAQAAQSKLAPIDTNFLLSMDSENETKPVQIIERDLLLANQQLDEMRLRESKLLNLLEVRQQQIVIVLQRAAMLSSKSEKSIGLHNEDNDHAIYSETPLNVELDPLDGNVTQELHNWLKSNELEMEKLRKNAMLAVKKQMMLEMKVVWLERELKNAPCNGSFPNNDTCVKGHDQSFSTSMAKQLMKSTELINRLQYTFETLESSKVQQHNADEGVENFDFKDVEVDVKSVEDYGTNENSSLSSQLVELKQRLKNKYKQKIHDLKNQNKSLQRLLSNYQGNDFLVKEIPSSSGAGFKCIFDATTNSVDNIEIFPELLSPEATLQLLKFIGSRYCNTQEFQDIFLHPDGIHNEQ